MFPVDTKILVVDDSSFARQTIKNSLREMKYWKIIEAPDAKAAQALLLDEEKAGDKIQLAILDIHMPDANGLELLRWIRARESFKTMPVIMLTASQEKSDILEAGKFGASTYIIKPLEPGVLRDRMAQVWNRMAPKAR